MAKNELSNSDLLNKITSKIQSGSSSRAFMFWLRILNFLLLLLIIFVIGYIVYIVTNRQRFSNSLGYILDVGINTVNNDSTLVPSLTNIGIKTTSGVLDNKTVKQKLTDIVNSGMTQVEQNAQAQAQSQATGAAAGAGTGAGAGAAAGAGGTQ